MQRQPGYHLHGAHPYYVEHFPWDSWTNPAGAISLFETKKQLHQFDPDSFDKRKLNYEEGEHEPPNDANPANAVEWYKDTEGECWKYAGDAFQGMCQEAYKRPAADVASADLDPEEILKIF